MILAATQITRPDAITFWLMAVLSVLAACGVILFRNPVHSALSLVGVMFAMAVLFVAQNAQFLAAVQVIVYAGAVVVLFLFVIMLIGVDRAERIGGDHLRSQRWLGALVSVVVLAEIILLSRTNWVTGVLQTTVAPADENVRQLARSMFSRYVFPFEITSVLLIIAVIAAVVLARRSEPDKRDSSSTEVSA